MKMSRIICFVLFALCISLNAHGKSIENVEEKTNGINEVIKEDASTVEPEAEPEAEPVSVDQSTVAETTELTETTEPGTTEEPTTREPEQCNADSYCEAEVLPSKLILNSTFIMCDQRIQPKYRCCLPNGPHLVCYNIMVDGQYLNYDNAVAQLSTDIYGLCTTIIASQNKEQGQYTAASIEDGEGRLVYNYKKWTTLEENNAEKPQHIKDLACGIVKKP